MDQDRDTVKVHPQFKHIARFGEYFFFCHTHIEKGMY